MERIVHGASKAPTLCKVFYAHLKCPGRASQTALGKGGGEGKGGGVGGGKA